MSPGLEPLAPLIARRWPGLRWSVTDARPGASFSASRGLERHYLRQLASVAGRVGAILKGRGDPARKVELLRDYREALGPWSEAVAGDLMRRAERRNRDAWQGLASKISAGLARELTRPVDGVSLQFLIEKSASRIQNLPDEAAAKVAELVSRSQVEGLRAEDVARELEKIEGMTRIRADLIARTEVSKANTACTRLRAERVGSEGYIWRTARDGRVRDSHAQMEGRFVYWTEPPTLDGWTGHAGEFARDRCYPEPVIPLDGQRRGVHASPLPTREQEEADPQLGLLSRWERVHREVVPHAPGEALPGADRAVVPMGKIAAYALDPEHPKGKARLFRGALGLTQKDADDLARQLREGVKTATAYRDERPGAVATDKYGERLIVHIPVTGPNGRTVELKTVWVYDRDPEKKQTQASRPRLVTLFPP